MIGGTSDDQSHEQRPGDQRKTYKNRSRGKIDKVRDALYGNTATTSTKAVPSFNSQARDINYDENEMFWNFQTLGNSRGQRMADPIIMYQNYGVPTKARIVNLEDKQIVFPEDDDSDIIIVNEDFNRNIIEDVTAENLKEEFGEIETTTEKRFKEYLDAHEYVWMTTEWSPCNVPCGQTGHQIRGAVCQHKKHNSTTTVETDECISRGVTPPEVLKTCSSNACANWRTSPWSPVRCLASGAAVTRRRVECVAENGTVLQNTQCEMSSQPEKTRREAKPCRPAWSVGAWSKCIGPCGRGRQHRTLRCVWRSVRTRLRERSAGAACEGLRRPAVSRPCRYHNCTDDGVCRDTSRFCENVRAMNMCALRRYKEQCCKTCSD